MDPSAVDVDSIEISVESPDGRYRLTAVSSMVGDHRYLDATTAERRSP